MLKTLEVKEKELKLKVTEMEKLEKQLYKRETKGKTASTTAMIQQYVKFNVGGQLFMISKATMQKHRGSFFDNLLSSDHSPQDDDGNFLLDRDPKYFRTVLNYMREGKVKDSDKAALTPLELDELRQEFIYFKTPVPGFLLINGGDLLTSVEHRNEMREWIPQKWFSLIYKATRDGFAAADFHTMCDNQEGTVVVIRSGEGHLFGGFTSQSWIGNGYKEDPTAFIFTLTNPHGIPPTKYTITNSNFAISCGPSRCAAFGRDDFYVESDHRGHYEAFSSFPESYDDSTGQGAETFTGEQYFFVLEVEVYSVL